MLRDEDSHTYFQNTNFNNCFKRFLYFETIKILEALNYINEVDKVIDNFEINMQIQKINPVVRNIRHFQKTKTCLQGWILQLVISGYYN